MTTIEDAAGKIYKSATRTETHLCIYRYSIELAEYFKENKNSVAGYRGICFADFVWIDIDRKDSPAESLNDCRKLVTILRGLGIESQLRIYFSGSKGFHLAVPIEYIEGVHPHKDFPVLLRFFAEKLCGDIEIDKDLYRHLNLLRLNNTINEKSGLYKIRVSEDELENLSIEEIKELARTERTLPEDETEITPNASLSAIWQEALKEYELWAKNKDKQFQDKQDVDSPPPNRKLCIWKLLRQGADKGKRHDSMLRLAVHYRKEGFGQNEVYALIIEWNKKNVDSHATDGEIYASVKGVFAGNYDYGCFDPVLDDNCDKRCYLYPAKMKIPIEKEGDLKREIQMDKYISSVYVNFESYKKVLAESKWISLEPWLPTIANTVRGYIGGIIVVWLAFTGVGKSVIKDNFNRHIIIPSLNYELELPRLVRAERHLQSGLQINSREVEKLVRDEQFTQINEGLKKFEHVFSVDQPEMSVKDIKEYYYYFCASWYPKHLGVSEPVKIPLINIDNLGDVQGGKGGNTYEQVSDKIRSIRNLSKELNIAIQVFAHIKRDNANDGRKEPSLGSGKDSSVIENIADMIFCGWRPNYLKEDDNELYIKNLKNRLGRAGSKVGCELILDTMTIREQKANENLANYKDDQLNLYAGQEDPF